MDDKEDIVQVLYDNKNKFFHYKIMNIVKQIHLFMMKNLHINAKKLGLPISDDDIKKIIKKLMAI